jgi:hypothetical protein
VGASFPSHFEYYPDAREEEGETAVLDILIYREGGVLSFQFGILPATTAARGEEGETAIFKYFNLQRWRAFLPFWNTTCHHGC